MKSLFAALVLVVASVSIAQAQAHRPPPGIGGGGPMIHPPALRIAPAQITYESLNVREINITPPRFAGSTTLRKAVGGLQCLNVRPVRRIAGIGTFECQLAPRRQNAQAIYNAMNVAAQRDRRPAGGYIIDVKTAGRLTCREARPVRPRAMTIYSCELN
jgi:hypothetical protein